MIKLTMNPYIRNLVRALARLRILLVLSLVWMGPTIACGSFAPRPTPTPTLSPTPTEVLAQAVATQPAVEVASTPIPQLPVDTPTPEAAPALEAVSVAAPPSTSGLVAGGQARVSAPAGLNFRDAPNTGARLLGQLGTGQRVSVVEGPVAADNFTWWRLDDGQGNVGWAAEGDGTTIWISPQLGEPQAVNRPPRVGDRVVVTMPAGGQLSVRALPGTNAQVVRRVNSGQQFTVLAGPQSANGFTWYQIRSDDGSLEGWAADGDAAARWLSPLE
jgi:hypothetical protein